MMMVYTCKSHLLWGMWMLVCIFLIIGLNHGQSGGVSSAISIPSLFGQHSTTTRHRSSPLLAITLGTSIRRRSHSARKRANRRASNDNDRLSGELTKPGVENAKEAIEQVPRTILAMRLKNHTIVAFTAPTEMGLIIPMGTSVVSPLVSPHIHLAVTGWSGDSRLLRRHLKEVVVNHTIAFVDPPSARYLATAAGNFIEKYHHQRRDCRLLACHAFIIDTRPSPLMINRNTSTTTTEGAMGLNAGTETDVGVTIGNRDEEELRFLLEEEMKRPIIYEIDAEGMVTTVLAGVAGRKRTIVFQKLEDALIKRATSESNETTRTKDKKSLLSVLAEMSVDDAQTLIADLMKECIVSNVDESDNKDDNDDSLVAVSTLSSKKSDMAIRFLTFPHK